MTDAADGAAAPPKKRSFFKTAAWQNTPKPEGSKDDDMFSHSNEFRDIVAEQARRKNEEKKKTEEARKRKVEEERKKKRRRVSNEHEDGIAGSRSGSSGRSRRRSSKGRSETPLSPTRNAPSLDTLASRYEASVQSPSSSSAPKLESNVIDLGDSDDEFAPEDNAWLEPTKQTIPIHLGKPAPSEDLEEVDDPRIAALKAKARARAAEKAALKDQVSASPVVSEKPKKSAIVQLLLTSYIPDTRPLMVKVRTEHTLDKPKNAWCGKQGFTEEQTRNMFMTWNNTHIYDSTTVQRLGLTILDNGCTTVQGDPTIYDESNPPKIHVDVWSDEVYKQWKKEEAEEAAARKKAAEAPALDEPEPEPEPETQVQKIRLHLKAKGKPDLKITVNPDTEISRLTAVYKQARDVPEEQPITLMFDGERLRPMDVVGDTDIDDLDSIEVHFK